MPPLKLQVEGGAKPAPQVKDRNALLVKVVTWNMGDALVCSLFHCCCPSTQLELIA
jgi:hypothetical protein